MMLLPMTTDDNDGGSGGKFDTVQAAVIVATTDAKCNAMVTAVAAATNVNVYLNTSISTTLATITTAYSPKSPATMATNTSKGAAKFRVVSVDNYIDNYDVYSGCATTMTTTKRMTMKRMTTKRSKRTTTTNIAMTAMLAIYSVIAPIRQTC